MKNFRGMSAPFLISVSFLATIFLVITAAPSAAQVAGVRISTPVTTIPNIGTADFAVTVYGAGTYGGQLSPGMAIDATNLSTYTTSYDFGFGYAPTVYSVRLSLQSDFNTTVPAAVEYGDGQSLQSTILPLDATAIGPNGTTVFRGSFSHTYADAGIYQLRARMTSDGRFPGPGLGLATTANPNYPPFTGNASTGVTLSNQFAFAGTIRRTAAPTTPVNQYSFSYTYFYPQTIRYITNTASVSIVAPPDPEPPILAIPTLQESALLTLAALLALAGLLVLRRGA